jgi:hypothetical protein
LPQEVRDLPIASSKRFIQAFDNLSGIPPAISDMLCRLSTGGGFAIRSLYTDNEETIFSYTRPVMLAGIEDVAGRHDLSDRTSSLTLERIPEREKKVLSEMRAAFGRTRPRILGRLLDIAAQGLRNLPHTRLSRYPRMADYARWMAACETAEWETGTFAHAHAANKAHLAAASLEADVVATLIIEMLAGGSGWRGTAKDLLAQINNRATDQQKRDKHWPKTPRGMTSRSRHLLMMRAVRSGIPVARVGRGNNDGFTPARAPFIGGRNLTATKARLLLMACLLKFGSLPPAADPDDPTPAEMKAIQNKVEKYQQIFDTH